MSPSEYEIDPDGIPPAARNRREREWWRGPGRWVAVGLVIALVIGTVLVFSFTRTQWGRAQVLTYTLRTLGGGLTGNLQVDSLNGSLLTGAKLYGISLSDTAGAPLAIIDSAYIDYRVATFTGGDIVIRRLHVFGARIDLFRMPGDTLWNYEAILQDPSPAPETGEESATLVERLAVTGGVVTVRVPLEVDSRLSPERQQEEMELILSDTARWALEELPEGGYMKTSLMTVSDGEVRNLFIGSDARGGVYLEVLEGAGEVRLWQEPPLELRAAAGSLHLREGILNYDATRIELPNSTGTSVGRVDMRGERPMYDVYLTTSRVTLSDLRWLYPWLPTDPAAGWGAGELFVEDREDGLVVVAREVVLSMPDTRVTGRFGLIADAVADEIRFVDVDLEAVPLRVESVEQLLPEDLPVEGLIIGGATIRGES